MSPQLDRMQVIVYQDPNSYIASLFALNDSMITRMARTPSPQRPCEARSQGIKIIRRWLKVLNLVPHVLRINSETLKALGDTPQSWMLRREEAIEQP